MGGAAIGASILDQEYFDWQQGTLRRAAQAGTENSNSRYSIVYYYK